MKIYKQNNMAVVDRENNRDYLLLNSKDIFFETRNNNILILYSYNNTNEEVSIADIKRLDGTSYGNNLEDVLLNLITVVS